jgi:hypothetical protein
LHAGTSAALDILNNGTLATNDVGAGRGRDRDTDGLLIKGNKLEQIMRMSPSTYLRSNLLSHLAEGLSYCIYGAFSIEDDRTARATAHVHSSLRSARNVTENFRQRLLQLSAGEHLRRSETELLHVLSRKSHDTGDIYTCVKNAESITSGVIHVPID